MKTPVQQAPAEATNAIIEYTNSEAYERDQERYNELLVRSATDLDFRQKLLTDPMAALEEFYGQEIPAEARGLNIRFIENEADATIVLPDPVTIDAELSDSELELVAGGVNPSAAASAAVSATGSPVSAVASAIVSGGFALAAIWLATQ